MILTTGRSLHGPHPVSIGGQGDLIDSMQAVGARLHYQGRSYLIAVHVGCPTQALVKSLDMPQRLLKKSEIRVCRIVQPRRNRRRCLLLRVSSSLLRDDSLGGRARNAIYVNVAVLLKTFHRRFCGRAELPIRGRCTIEIP